MNIINKLLTLCFIVIFSFSAGGQTTNEHQLVQGDTLNFHVYSAYFAPSLASLPLEENTIEFLYEEDNNYYYQYIPNPDFVGSDGFTLTVITVPFPPQNIDNVFLITVAASEYKSSDDFVRLSNIDEVVLTPLVNDIGLATTIVVGHVMNGAVVVNDDLSFSYTPLDTNPDYIVYTAKDEVGTISTSTIYITFESESDDASFQNFEISSGNSQYIILPNDGYTLVAEDLEYGTIEQINEYVYNYIADESVFGNENFHFTHSVFGTHFIDVKLYNKYVDQGNVKDDKFFSAANTMSVFDVKENDLSSNNVISSYSEELYHLGNGVFAYTPDAGFTGTKIFSYTVDNGSSEESGEVKIYFNNFKPNIDAEYNFTSPKNQPRIFEYNMPILTEFFEISKHPSNGALEIFSESETIDLGCDEDLQKLVIVYTPNENYVGSDDFIVRYCASDNNVCDDISIDVLIEDTDIDDCICVDDCVWPGDANADGRVSIIDALAVGQNIGNGGAIRDTAIYNDIYQGASTEDWLGFQANGKNVKHTDTDGDGFVTEDDFQAIVDNFGKRNSITTKDALGIKYLPFYLSTPNIEVEPGDLFTYNVHLGSLDYPAVDLQGVAFAINNDSEFVDSATVEVIYPDNSYFVKDAPFASLTHQPIDGIIHTAGIKTNRLGSTGHGIIATVSFVVEEVAEGFKDVRRAIDNGNTIRTITIDDIVIEDKDGEQFVLPSTSLDVIVRNSYEEANSDFSIYPNPSEASVKIITNINNEILNIKIFDIHGKIVINSSAVDSSIANVDISFLKQGLYFVSITSRNGTETKRLVKK
ncbi:MAG: T9SS type A sorting domain-containing protein [Saprospiraceae bacterium]